MSFKKLELQEIEELVFEKKRDENSAVISILGEPCELQFLRGIFTFRKHIASIDEIDADTITRLTKCLSVQNGGLSHAHSFLTCVDDQVESVMVLAEDEIINVKTHDRIVNFMCLAQCLDEVFTSHSI